MRSLPEDVVYGIGRIDASGRIADQGVITMMGWRGGDRLTFSADAGVVTARRAPRMLNDWKSAGGITSGQRALTVPASQAPAHWQPMPSGARPYRHVRHAELR